MEKESKFKKEQSIINQKEIQGFIKNRNIHPEDFHLIEELASFPNEMIIMEFHNLFNMYHERSGRELETMIRNTPNVSKKKLYETMKQFYQKYDWSVSWNLVRLLEEI